MQPLSCSPSDTIVAQASAIGRGGVGIVRLSGPNSHDIALSLCRNRKTQNDQIKPMLPRMAQLSTWYSECGSVIDQGLSLYFPGPRSFTGEDVVELQAHGGIVVMDWLVQSCISLGARHARPGEFSERAFLNGKLDLAQAEAVADLIDAASREAAVCASRSLQGAFSQKINRFLDILTQIRTHIEAAIDFVDEDLETDDIAKIYEKLVEACQQCKAIIQQAQTGVRLHEGARIAIVGAPNAGKSSLLNHLAQTSAAIVSDIPGTTRDVVKERIVLRGVPVEVLDTAGLRITEDPIEQQGIDRAKNALADADLILWIFDVLVCRPEQVLKDYQRYLGSIAKPESVLCLGNKIDLLPAGTAVEAANYALSPDQIFFGAIHTGQGISTFIDAIMTKLGVRTGVEGQFIARRRHVEALTEVLQSLENARDIIKVHPLELTAEELRLAQNALARITGEFTSDDLLGKIFSSFCVGK